MTITAKQSRDQALTGLEEARMEYLAHARSVAESYARMGDGTCTVDDVRRVLPPPEGMDPRVMGAVFTRKDWELVGYKSSHRRECHGRPIARFRLRGIAS